MSLEEVKVLIYNINNEYFATDILEVERILGYEKPTVVPEVPGFIEGVINYENNILPIINLSKKFKYNSNIQKDDNKIIVIKKEDKKFGVVVDNVSEVISINSNMCEAPPEITEGIAQKYIKGVIKINNKIILLLDMINILSREEEEVIFIGGQDGGESN